MLVITRGYVVFSDQNPSLSWSPTNSCRPQPQSHQRACDLLVALLASPNLFGSDPRWFSFPLDTGELWDGKKKMEHAAGTHWRWQKTVAFGTHFAIWSDQKFPPMGRSIQRGLKPKKKHPGTDPKKTAFLSGRQHVENHLDAFRIHRIGIGTTKDEVPPGRQVQDVRFLLLPLEPLSRWEISGGSSPIYQLVDYIDGPFQQTKNSKSCKHIQNQPWIRSDTVAKNRISKTLALRNRTTQVVSFSWGPTITARETLWAFEATSWYSE